MEINLFDKNFEGRDLTVSPKEFKWYTGSNVVSEYAFYTDGCLQKAAENNTIQKKVAWLLEPRAISPLTYEYIETNYKLFNYVLTFDRKLLSKINNGLYAPYGTYWVEDRKSYKKTKHVSIIASFKNETVGHKLRHHIINTTQNIDVYGKHPQYKFIQTKNEALDNYYYSIAIENSIQNSYWTEKILDCFVTKTIPLYWGTRDICSFFNSDGIIFFETASELRSILKQITPELYDEKKSAIHENYNIALKYKEPESYIFNNYNFLFT
jgi:hypothetical protein